MIRTLPYDPLAAMAVFRALDTSDLMEAQLVCGAQANHLTLFADWHSNQANCLLSLVVTTGPETSFTPFALLALANTGQSGVAQAAFLARDHSRFRRSLALAARAIADEMPALAVDAGIGRIEARSWAGHPTASAFLHAIGFRHECDMAGFGLRSDVVFRQFAWTHPAIFSNPTPQQETAECAK